jgi:HSP20 family protein
MIRPDWNSPIGLFFKDLSPVFSRWWTENDSRNLIGSYPVDIHEDESHVYVDAEMPGFTKDEIEVTLGKGVLHLSAERKTEDRSKKGEPHLVERRFTRIARSFTLPIEVNESSVQARVSDGVLHLVLNKPEEVKPRKIVVN